LLLFRGTQGETRRVRALISRMPLAIVRFFSALYNTVPAVLPFISFDLSAWHWRQNCEVWLDKGFVSFGL
jgi:hypothetical protein